MGCTDQTVFRVILDVLFVGTFGLIRIITLDFSCFVVMKNAKRSQRNGKNH